jgi:hypothetical protein
VNPFLDSTLAAIREEAEATRPLYMALAPAVAELVADRVERGILNAAEAATIFAALAAEYDARRAEALAVQRRTDARRSTRDLCQDCWQDANPTEYAPVATRYGPCAECGAEALIVRSHEAPAVVNPDGTPTAATLAFFGRDAAAPCRCPGIPGAHAFKADGCNFGPGRFRFHARY